MGNVEVVEYDEEDSDENNIGNDTCGDGQMPDWFLNSMLNAGQFVEYGPSLEPRAYDSDEIDALTSGQAQIISNCDQPVTTCDSAHQFIKQMDGYNQCQHKNDVDSNELVHTLDDYMHLIHAHNDDIQFEYIVNKLGECDMNTCQIFRRNYRNRNIIPEYYKDDDNTPYKEILDRMHSHFYHCYDIGNRLYIKDKEIINSVGIENEEKKETDDDDDDDDDDEYELLFNKQIKKMYEILNPRQQKYKLLRHDINNDNNNSKYHQLLPIVHDENEEKIINTNNDDNDTPFDAYHPGYKFDYNHEHDNDLNEHYIFVKAKYESLKDELISNPLAPINFSHFASEYKKALIKIQTHYMKKQYLPMLIGQEPYAIMMEIKHILALMFYCNYDRLQYEFTKTYREEKGNNHKYFCILGRYLTECVEKFGDNFANLGINKFYHGISQRLVFQDFPGPHFQGIQLNCPLSTTSSYQVAMNFTNHNKGLVIEFGLNEVGMGAFTSSKCMPCEWISDFANEKEYFFFGTDYSLMPTNIFEPANGIAYEPVINILKFIDKQMFRRMDDDKDCDESMMELIKAIISNQLSYNNKNFKSFKSLTSYGKILCDNYFKNKYTDIKINYLVQKQKLYWNAMQLLQYNKMRWFDLELIYLLYPKIEFIEIEETDLNESIMDNILMYFQNNEQFLAIKIKVNNNELEIEDAVKKYREIFGKMNIVIYKYIDDEDKDSNHLIVGRVRQYRSSVCWFTKYDYYDHYFSKYNSDHFCQLIVDIAEMQFDNIEDGDFLMYQNFIMDKKINGDAFNKMDEDMWLNELKEYSKSCSPDIAKIYYRHITKHKEECRVEEESDKEASVTLDIE